MKVSLLITWDVDQLDATLDRARVADEVAEVRKINQSLDAANRVWTSWIVSGGGSVVELNAGKGTAEIAADKLTELERIRDQVASTVGSTISMGVGVKLSEAQRALKAAKLQGGNKVTLYTPDVDEFLEKEQKKEEGLQKAGETSPNVQSKDRNPTQAAQKQADEGPAAPEATKADTSSLEDQFHAAAQAQEAQDQQPQQAPQPKEDQLRAQVVQVLQNLKQQMPILEQVKQSAPDTYNAVLGLAQAVIGMARQMNGDSSTQTGAGELNDRANSQAQFEVPLPPEEGEGEDKKEETKKAEKAFKLYGDAVIEVDPKTGRSLGKGPVNFEKASRPTSRPIPVQHYSNAPDLTQLDPAYQGTGMAGVEANRSKRIPRTYFYTNPGTPEAHIAGGSRYRYTGELPAGTKLYDMGSDPLNLTKPRWVETEQGMLYEPSDHDSVERKLKKLGYHGYRNYGTQDAIAYFRKLPVKLERSELTKNDFIAKLRANHLALRARASALAAKTNGSAWTTKYGGHVVVGMDPHNRNQWRATNLTEQHEPAGHQVAPTHEEALMLAHSMGVDLHGEPISVLKKSGEVLGVQFEELKKAHFEPAFRRWADRELVVTPGMHDAAQVIEQHGGDFEDVERDWEAGYVDPAGKFHTRQQAAAVAMPDAKTRAAAKKLRIDTQELESQDYKAGVNRGILKGEWKDKLPGGKADDDEPEDYPLDKLVEGMNHELEHTDDPSTALEIAMDHLAEDSDYYEKLKAIEKSEVAFLPHVPSSGVTKKAEPISHREVVRHLKNVDNTGDEEWLGQLAQHVGKHPQWQLSQVPIADLDTGDERNPDVVSEYAQMSPDTRPAIVAAPDESGKLWVMDGGHRTQAAQQRGEKTVLAYTPLGWFDAGTVPAERLRQQEVQKASLQVSAPATGRHHLQLPAGSKKDPGAEGAGEKHVGTVKVKSPDTGEEKWREMRAGMVASPDGTPASALNPNASFKKGWPKDEKENTDNAQTHAVLQDYLLENAQPDAPQERPIKYPKGFLKDVGNRMRTAGSEDKLVARRASNEAPEPALTAWSKVPMSQPRNKSKLGDLEAGGFKGKHSGGAEYMDRRYWGQVDAASNNAAFPIPDHEGRSFRFNYDISPGVDIHDAGGVHIGTLQFDPTGPRTVFWHVDEGARPPGDPVGMVEHVISHIRQHPETIPFFTRHDHRIAQHFKGP